MTDRYNALTVILDRDIREDDAEPLVSAIRMLRGVLSVRPHVAGMEDHIATERATQEIRKRLFDALERKGGVR